mgnify:CR=1 FL=1
MPYISSNTCKSPNLIKFKSNAKSHETNALRIKPFFNLSVLKIENTFKIQLNSTIFVIFSSKVPTIGRTKLNFLLLSIK